tara:strand:- start:161 stop:388 length:228 start_codon:yes stop_codon:yes gene_type:complete
MDAIFCLTHALSAWYITECWLLRKKLRQRKRLVRKYLGIEEVFNKLKYLQILCLKRWELRSIPQGAVSPGVEDGP